MSSAVLSLPRWAVARVAARRRLLLSGAAALATVALIVAVGNLAPRGLPFSIVCLGLLVGALNALVAVGLVLVYRAGSYVNFAQGGMGAAGAVVAAKLIVVNGVTYWLAAPAGIVASMALAWLAEVTVIRRLFRAPRLILTVGTIGLATAFGFIELFLGVVWRDEQQLAPRLNVPLGLEFNVGDVIFRGEHVMVLIVFPMVVAGLIAFFRFSDFGAAIQASAENADRARLLGISVRRVSSFVWVLAGALGGITAILQAPIVGFTFGTSSGPGLLLRALAPAMIGGMTSLGWAVTAALGLGIVEQAISWNTNASGPVDAALFGVILLSLLVQRRRKGRTTEGEERSFAAASAVRPFPRELARIPAVATTRAALRVALLAFAVAVPLFLTISQRNLASLILIYVIAAVSLTILSGYAGQVSFGHWAFVGFGALLGGHLVTAQDLPIPVAFAVTCVAGALLALLIGLPALRIRGLFLAVATLAFAVAASSYLFTWRIFQVTDVVRRPTLLGVDFDDERNYYWLCLVAALFTLWVARNLRASRWGRNFVAVRDNERAAASYGVSVVASKLLAFVVSGFLASLAGFLYLFNQTNITAGAFPVEASLVLFAAVVIGGIGSLPGAIIGALYLRGIQFFAPTLQLFTTSFGLLLVIMFFPAGLGGLAFRGRDAVLRHLANRWGVIVPSLVADRRAEAEAFTSAESSLEEART